MNRLAALLFALFAFPALFQTIEFLVPGAVKLNFISTAVASSKVVLKPVPLNPTDRNLQLPTKKATLLYPKERPAWCDESANVCYGPKDKGKILFNAGGGSMRPHAWPYFKVSSGGTPAEGKACESRHFRKGLTGVVVFDWKWDRKAKKRKKRWLCQPMLDGKAHLHVQVKPGHTYNRCFHAWLFGDFIVSSPKGTPLDQRPILLAYKANSGSKTGVEPNACIASRSGRNLTVYGIVVKNVEKISGRWTKPRIKDPYYRCIQPGIGALKVVNSDFENCPHGVQGGGTEWHIYNSKFLNCSYAGTGYNHCLYGSHGLNKITVTGSTLQTCGGHAFKGIAKEAVIENSRLETGVHEKCDSGTVFHNSYGGKVTLDSVHIVKGKDKGNPNIFGTGDGSSKRCKGVDGYRGIWTLKNVEITDNGIKFRGRRVLEIKGGCKRLKRSKWIDKGNATYNGRPLAFKNAFPKFPK